MKPGIFVLAEPDQFRGQEALDRIFRKRAEYVAELSLLYTTIKERRAELILIGPNYPGVNATLVRKMRMRSPQADIWQLSWSGARDRIDSDTVFDGVINLAEGPSGITKTIDRILEQKELLRSYGIVGLSEKTRLVAETIKRIAPTDISILIIGPSGAGKELVARAVHDYSRRSEARFVAVNCGALAEGVLESELFGHEKGAFTGSVGKREGLFRQADSGTIFLDEIGETKPDMQVRLLRVLEDGVFYPVGGDRPVRADVRVIAATNRDLAEAIADGAFREDLYFRLGVVKINLVPLYDRRQDIIPLLYNFAEKEAVTGFSERAVDLLVRYDWPGNVRQLRNFVARMAALHSGEEVSRGDVEQFIAEQGLGDKRLPVVTGHTGEEAGHELIYHALLQLGNEVRMLRDLITANLPPTHEMDMPANAETEAEMPSGFSIEEMERDMIDRTLRETGGNRKEAARRLKIGERTLYRKLKKYDLN